MPPKARTTATTKAPASRKRATSTSSSVASASASRTTAGTSTAGASRPAATPAAAAVRKREHAVDTSGESPVKKKETKEEPSQTIFMAGFTPAEVDKYEKLVRDESYDEWEVQRKFSDSVTHLVIKNMTSIKHPIDFLPIYCAVLKGLHILRPSFLPHGVPRRKSLGGPRHLENEKSHAYDGRELDATAQSNSNNPTIVDIVAIGKEVEMLAQSRRKFFGAAPFRKVVILAGRKAESKQRKEYLKMVMEAGGATVLEDSVWKAWQAKRKKGGEIETPSLVVIVNGESSSSVGLDDETIRDILRARAPLFFEEWVTKTLRFRQEYTDTEALLGQSFAFIHDEMKTVDADRKVRRQVMNEDEDEMPPLFGDRTPSGRRLNSRVSSSARESSSREQIEREKSTEKSKEKEEKDDKEKDDGKKEKTPTEVKRGRGRPRNVVKEEVKEEEKKENEKKEEKNEDKKEEGKEPKKEVKKGRPRKEESKKEEGKKEEKKNEEKKKEDKKKGEEPMEQDDVDPALADGNLMDDFEREIEEANRGGERRQRTAAALRELREIREMRGDRAVTPEPVIFSQLSTQAEIEIPEELRRALEVKEEEEGEKTIKKEEEDDDDMESLTSNTALDDSTETIKAEDLNEDMEDMEKMREEMNNERAGGGGRRDEEDERSLTPMGYDPRSDLNSIAAPIVVEDAKECETCNHLGAQHLYINQQTADEIEDHFNAPRLEWFDLLTEIQEKMPWLKQGKQLRPACDLGSRPMSRVTLDLFSTYYHQLDAEAAEFNVLDEVNASDAMEMYEADWEEKANRRPPIGMMMKMLHEFSLKTQPSDMEVPERACRALKNAIPTILPSSMAGRHFWLTVLAGGSQGIKGRASQVIEEMAKRSKAFLEKTLIEGFYHPCVVEFVVYLCEVDLLCAQTTVVPYAHSEEHDELTDSQKKPTRARRAQQKKGNPLDTFPFVLLLVMELDEEPRKGLSESAMLVLQKLLELTVGLRRTNLWTLASILNRALLCVLEAARWHCAKAVSSALTGAERRRVKAAESEGKSIQVAGVQMELQQNIQRVVRYGVKRGIRPEELREAFTISWLEDILDAM